MRIGGAAGFLEFLQRCAWFADTQIVGDGAVKQVGVLVYDADQAADLPETQVAQIASPDPHRATGRVIEAKKQADNGRLAGAAGPDKRDSLAGRYLKNSALRAQQWRLFGYAKDTPLKPMVGDSDSVFDSRGRPCTRGVASSN